MKITKLSIWLWIFSLLSLIAGIVFLVLEYSDSNKLLYGIICTLFIPLILLVISFISQSIETAGDVVSQVTILKDNISFTLNISSELLKYKIFREVIEKLTRNLIKIYNAGDRVCENQLLRIMVETNELVEQLEVGHIYEYDPGKFHDFVSKIFSMAPEMNEKIIRATSIVDPQKFWEDPKAIAYLSKNKDLVEKHNIDFKRTFFLENNSNECLERYSKVIKSNIEHRIDVSIVFVNEIPNQTQNLIYKDFGYIGERIAIFCEVSEIRKIDRVDCFIDVGDKINEAHDLFRAIDQYAKKVEDVYHF